MSKNKKKKIKKVWDSKHKKIIKCRKKMILKNQKQVNTTMNKFKNPTCCQIMSLFKNIF